MKNKGLFAAFAAVFTTFSVAIGLCIRTLLAPQAVFGEEKGQLTVVLDAGHGGVDGGVVGKKTKIKESTLNLQITWQLAAILEDMGLEVVLTRKTEAGLYGLPTKGFKRRDMQKRKEVIEQANPDLVVSVHQNFYPSSSTRGAQVFYAKANEASAAFARVLQAQLNGLYAEHGVKPRNSKFADYYMLECTQNASVIIECGFLSNHADEALLVQPSFQRELASAVASGIVQYLSNALS